MKEKERGFTLLEMMVVVGIVGILATFALPAYQEWMTHSAVNNSAQTLMAKLKQARNMAVAENRNVTLSFTASGFTYDVGVCRQCRQEVVTFANEYPNLVLSHTGVGDLTFTSSGTVNVGNRTFTLSQRGYQKQVIVNMIGRAYEN